MSPLRNTAPAPTQRRHMARVAAALGSAAAAGRTALRAFAPALALSVAGLTVACADGPTAPGARGASASAAPPAYATTATNGGGASAVLSQTTVGDTVVTRFVVGTNTMVPATINIGNSSKIDFPYAAGSICDLATSSYGPAYWNASCAASKTSVTVTAKSWVNAEGKVATDFQPAMRFVPGLKQPVKLTLRDAALAGTHVDFCTADGACVNEALLDPTVATQLNPTNGFVTRVLKHFSGYVVIANRTSSGTGY